MIVGASVRLPHHKMDESSMSIFALVIFVVASLPGLMVEGSFCMVEIDSPVNQFNKNCKCYQVANYTEQLESVDATTDLISFGFSRIPVLKNRSFDKFAENLEALLLYYDGITEIEDDAFQGLRNLSLLSLVGNRLEVIKGVWFNNLPKLNVIALSDNHIKTIEGTFFTTLISPLAITVARNELNCLPREEFRAKYDKIEDMALYDNPWDPECLTWLQSFVSEEDLAHHWPASGRNHTTKPPAFEETIHSKEDLCAFLEIHPDPYYDCGRDAE